MRDVYKRQALSTRFTLQVNGNDLPGTFLRIEKETGEPGFYAAQALIRLESASSSVSYTHLDVYKRQDLICSMAFRVPSAAMGSSKLMIIMVPLSL